MKQLTTKQTCLLFSLSIISLKLLILPALMTGYAKNDTYLSVILSLTIDFLFILLIVYVMKEHPDKTLFQLLEHGFGKVFAKLIVFALFVYFFAKLVMTIKETHNYLYELLFESFSWYFFIFPLFVTIFFVVKSGLKTIGRSVQLVYYILTFGAIISILLPINTIQFDNLLPFLANGVTPIIKSSFNTNFAFGDYIILLLFMGKIKFEKNTGKKIITYVLITDAVIVAFYIVFIAVFGNLAINESLALNDIPLFSNDPSINGKLEWVGSILWTMILIFQAIILLYCCKECFNFTFSFVNENVNLFIIFVLLLSVLAYLYLSLAFALKIIFSKPAVITSLVIQLSVPLLVLISSIIYKRKICNEKNIKQN